MWRHHILQQKSEVECSKFETLFLLYGTCHDVFNSSTYLESETIDALGTYM